ncbi:Tn3 family transposase [Streptomyces bauhiniae]|uniref:Tn3 family transposase n=1 Tax=Streptomyces bauhiniae TaxID=2340725 RepID=UPI00365DD167
MPGCGRRTPRPTTARSSPSRTTPSVWTAAAHTIRLDRSRAHWDDMLRVAGSLTLNEIRGHDLIRMLSRDGKPTGLGDAFAHYGRIFKTLHLLQFVSDEGYRRMIGAQLNVTEARHRLARKIFFGQRGELRQHYREGMEPVCLHPACGAGPAAAAQPAQRRRDRRRRGRVATGPTVESGPAWSHHP